MLYCLLPTSALQAGRALCFVEALQVFIDAEVSALQLSYYYACVSVVETIVELWAGFVFHGYGLRLLQA
jgi:hypothetical protein